jgi:tRNA threonylcarbamoyladenosine biosynthesis protein TsaB
LKSENTNNLSPLLSIETSSSECGACVYFDNEKFYQTFIRHKNIHAEKLFETIDSALKSAQINQEDLKAIAISNGPGSFTGLRIGMSAAKGIAYGSSIPLIPVPTFEALALQIVKNLPENSTFAIANKVNIDEVYFAKFQIKSNNYIFVEKLQIMSYNDFLISSKDVLTFGNASRKKESDWNYKKEIFAPEPKYVAEWAVTCGSDKILQDIDYLEPNYLKNFTIKVR